VEHPVTEQVYGLDLVRLQIKLANGDRLDRTQESVIPRFHALECRVNAEDPKKFVPSPGLVTGYHQPGGYGVRVDTIVYEQYRVQPHYDSLVAKLICWGDKREVAHPALSGPSTSTSSRDQTNILFHKRVLATGVLAGTTPASSNRSRRCGEAPAGLQPKSPEFRILYGRSLDPTWTFH
jgi:acetyl-CoA carboxylase biotin carboxylase subunit